MISALPPELLLCLGHHLPTYRDKNSLARTSRRIHSILNPFLYRKNNFVLLWAAEHGRISTIQLALNSHGDLKLDEATSDNGESLLSIAAWHGKSHMVEWLIRAKAIDVNQRDRLTGHTVLLRAVLGNELEVVKVLLSAPGINVNLPGTELPHTPLSLAAALGHEEIAKLLLTAPRINPDAADPKGRTPLCWAAMRAYVSILKHLLQSGRVSNGSRQDSHMRPAAWWAAQAFRCEKQDRLTCLDLLLAEANVGADYRNEEGKTLLIWASMIGDVDVVSRLLQSGQFDIHATDSDGRTAFSRAAERSLSVMQLLYSKCEIDVNERATPSGNTPLWYAVQANYRWSVDWLLSLDTIDISVRNLAGQTLLEFVIVDDQPEMVEALLSSSRVYPNTRNQHGETPLHRAVICGNGNMVRQMVCHDRVNVNAEDNRGRTALSWAAEMGFDEIVAALLASPQMDAAIADKNGQTPLSFALSNGNAICSRLLLNSEESAI